VWGGGGGALQHSCVGLSASGLTLLSLLSLLQAGLARADPGEHLRQRPAAAAVRHQLPCAFPTCITSPLPRLPPPSPLLLSDQQRPARQPHEQAGCNAELRAGMMDAGAMDGGACAERPRSNTRGLSRESRDSHSTIFRYHCCNRTARSACASVDREWCH
jgi:hypothetical protein